jgi:hypothetical protein
LGPHGFGSFTLGFLDLDFLGLVAFLPDDTLDPDAFLPDERLELPISFIIFFPKGLVFNTHLPVAGFLT